MESRDVAAFTYASRIGQRYNLQEEAKKSILKSYRTLYKLGCQASGNHSGDFLKLMKKAFRFVLQMYQEPNYALVSASVFYPIEIAVITADKFRLGAKSIICALLHDVIKGKKMTELTLKKEFGQEVTSIIIGFTKVSGGVSVGSKNETSNLRYVLGNFSPDNLLIVLIKFAEYLHKMYMIEQFSEEQQDRLAEEALNVYIPLAHSLGLDNIYLELQDLYLKHKYGVVYEAVLKKIKATKAATEGFLERFVAPIAQAFEREGIQFTLKGRTKSVASICSKIKDRDIPFEKIYDFYAIRIVFNSDSHSEYANCWAIYEIITSLYEAKISQLRDWVSYPRSSGYEALHIAVMSPEGQWVEVQIRTKRMDTNAEHGAAAHWKYKSRSLGPTFEHMRSGWLERARSYIAKHCSEGKRISLNVHRIHEKVTKIVAGGKIVNNEWSIQNIGLPANVHDRFTALVCFLHEIRAIP
eukprot:gene56-82_t